MSTINNPNNNNPVPQYPQLPMQKTGAGGWPQRLFGGNPARPLTLRQERTLPNWLIGSSVAVFFIAFAACTFAWGYPMDLQYAIISSLSILLFFYGSKTVINGGVHAKEKIFVRNAFIIGLVARLLWVLYCYFFFNPEHYGTTYGDSADVVWYMPFGAAIAEWLKGESGLSFSLLIYKWGAAIDDIGYPFWLAIVNLLTFGESDVLIPFLVKCIVGAYCAILIYQVAIRHFGEGTARMAALFVALNPNMIYWCGTMMKETELVFLCCLCVDLLDNTLSSGSKLTFKSFLPGVLVGMYIFFFRAPLAIVLFLAMGAHIVVTSRTKLMKLNRKEKKQNKMLPRKMINLGI